MRKAPLDMYRPTVLLALGKGAWLNAVAPSAAPVDLSIGWPFGPWSYILTSATSVLTAVLPSFIVRLHEVGMSKNTCERTIRGAGKS